MFFKRKKILIHSYKQSKIELLYKVKKELNITKFFNTFFYKIKKGIFFLLNKFYRFFLLLHPKHYRDFFKKIKKTGPEILAFLFICLVAWAFLQSTRLGAIALEIQKKILTGASGGAENLKQAKEALLSQDLDSASQKLNLALVNFNQSQKDFENIEKNLFGLGKILPQGKDAEKLLQASIDLAEAGKGSIKFLNLASGMSFGAQGLRGETTFNDLSVELKFVELKIGNANKNISSANISRLPNKEKELITDVKTKLDLTLSSISALKQLVFLGQVFFTGEKRILLVLQNQNELRPTGGFFGSYGALNLSNGKIQNLRISSIYDLDGQLKEKIMPPEPLLAVNQNWYLRDANWFTDFKQSAKKIVSFYEKEGGETPDLIIALTPKTIAGFLKITGPVKTINGVELTGETLLEQLQILTQSDITDPSNEPKKILGQLFTGLFQKIGELDSAGKAEILKILQENLVNKQLLFYSNNNQAQEILNQLHWTGEITDADRDYLLISSANLGGTKTDEFIEQKIKLVSKISQDGKIENTLTFIRSNKMPDAPGAYNKSFIRIYAPLGSNLLEVTGFDRTILERPTILENYKIDPQVLEWEKSSVKDVVSGTLIGKESNKTFFGNWVILNGGESRTLTLKYSLPFRLKNLDRHSLVLQKQSGASDFAFEYSISFPGRTVEWKNFDANDLETSGLSSDIILNRDNFFGMVLRKR